MALNELILFTHAENTCILRAIDTQFQAVEANPMFVSSNQGKNVMRYVFIRKIPISIEYASKKVERACVNAPLGPHCICYKMFWMSMHCLLEGLTLVRVCLLKPT